MSKFYLFDVRDKLSPQHIRGSLEVTAGFYSILKANLAEVKQQASRLSVALAGAGFFHTSPPNVTRSHKLSGAQFLNADRVADTSSLSILLRQSRRQKARKTHRMWMSSDNKDSRGSQETLSAAVCEPVSGRQRKSLGIQRPWPSGKSVK